jgi:hypothetical protein
VFGYWVDRIDTGNISMPEGKQPFWRFIPLDEYEPPSGPTTETLRTNFQNIMRRLGLPGRADKANAFSEHEGELKSIPDDLVARAAPEPNWELLHLEALTAAYQSWVDADAAAAGLHVLVDAPHSQLPQSVRKWAADNDCLIIEPPTTQQILDNDIDWLAQLNVSEATHWVLPSLERLFLRHENGLNLLRSWLDWTVIQPAGLVICDSWAWAFLSQALSLDQILPPASTLEPMDAAALTRWFRRLADRHSRQEYKFRQTDSGKLIYASAATEPNGNLSGAGDSPDTQDESDYLKHLAARSRGIPEIAWEIWKQSLLVEGDGEVEETAQEKASVDRGQTIWVQPWDQLSLPEVPGHFGANEAFVLHSLLLHDGLPDDLLSVLLPLTPAVIASGVAGMQIANLITEDVECRRVTALGYLAVRGFLNSEGFLTDDL